MLAKRIADDERRLLVLASVLTLIAPRHHNTGILGQLGFHELSKLGTTG